MFLKCRGPEIFKNNDRLWNVAEDVFGILPWEQSDPASAVQPVLLSKLFDHILNGE